ncbi:unnamed protein product [Symbiodinium microadriaticum]|nr:unnamed protein product [Symbiodinium microadriaticum]
MRRGVAWGRGLSFFLTVARLAVSRLTTSRPLLSDALFQECVEDMEVPSGVLLSLQSLSRVEMFCFIAIVRLHVRMRGGVTAGSGLLSAGRAGAYAVAAGRAGPVSDGRGFNVEKVLCEFERMTGLLKKKVVNKRHVVAAILALAENTELIVLSNGRLFAAPGRTGGGGSSGSLRGGRGAPGSGYPILDTTQVSVNVAMAEVLSIFSGSDISLPDKMRRAVFEPLDSLRTSHFDSVVASSSG